MDDDIDIEEHDVLDNPRIKSIFPDLSRVKLEIPDEEEDVDEEQYGILQPTEEPQEMLYQYEYSLETTRNDLPDETHSQEEDDEYVEENTTCFYNNEIILGSKPPPDLEVLYEEALNSHPIVYLENWEDRLNSSPCFCNTCEILFPTVNALDAHKMISHSYLVALDVTQKNTARKSTVTSKYCNHCSKTFPDDTSLIKHLYELLPLNNFPKIKEEKEPEAGKKFATPLPWPKKIKSTSHVITKIHPKRIKIEPKEVKIEPVSDKDTRSKLKSNKLQRDGKFFAASSLVPKSTLFQCNICQIGFLSCFSAAQHVKYCKKVLIFTKCGICKRKIRTKDFKTHELQHNYNDKLKIYTMNKTIYERVLCKCPKCFACFDELAFWAHYPKCKKSDRKSTYCTDCDVNISSLRYKRHRLKHSTKKLTKKDFIIIEFYDQKNMRANSENETDVMRVDRKERAKFYREKHRKKKMLLSGSKQNDGGITLYYCEFCGCCQYILNYKGHTDGSCKEITSKKYCEKCGLCFTAKSIESHLVLHEKRSFSLKDINIINLTTGKSIEPPMSEFFECDKCLKHFICRRTMTLHNCKTEKYITCKMCTKKFNVQAYKIHKIFHSVDKLMPELMKKYNLINSMWNVMYMCVSCELVTMSYDSAVTHSQGHLNYIISDLHKQCMVCDLRIAEKEFGLHQKLHSNNESIGRESFKILKYNYEDLFKKEWLMLFRELPKEHRQQILSKSIYRFTRSVKMQIEVSVSTDETKYFCMNCNTFVDGANIMQHMRSKCSRSNKLICNICHVIFKSLKHFLTHEGSHENLPKRQTVVTFNNECDKEFNNHLSLIESNSKKPTKDVPLSQLRELLLSDSSKATYKLYKCARCEVCVTLKSSIRRHRCGSGNKKRFCDICAQYFCAKKTAIHLEAHKKKPYITKDSFYVVYFNDSAKPVKKSSERDVNAKVPPKKEISAKVSPKKLMIAKIYKCKCGLHFTSMKTVEKHLDECRPKLEVSKETCSKCKLVFPTDVLVTHLINHHHKETKIVIEKIARANLLKCPNCGLFFTNMVNFNAHTENCFPKNGGIPCKNCGLSFGKKCFPKHLCSSVDVTYINKVTVVRKKIVKQATVYRCPECDITYLQRNSFRYHYFEVNHLLKKPATTCDLCGLKFTNCSLRKHANIHSFPNEDFKIKVMDPISGVFVFVTGTNKDDGNTDSERSSPRKRRGENLEETDSASVKKVKKSVIDTPLFARRTLRKTRDKPSISRDSTIDFDETQSELIVPDEISDHITGNISIVSDIDTDTSEMTSSDKMNETLDKNGLSSKLKSRIMVKGYSKELYKCISCNQHYMKEASFDYHVKTYIHNEKPDNYECDICGLEFSRHTLPRHKYVHHDYMGLKKDDFVILVGSAYSKEKDLKAKNNSKILDVCSENRDGIEVSENDTKALSNVNVSDTCDTKQLSDVNESEICDTKQLSDVNESEICDTKQLSDVNESEICDTKQLSDVNDSEIPDTKQLSDVNESEICDTKQLSDVNDSDICDTKQLSDVNDSEICNTKQLSDVNESEVCDTKQLSDVNESEICDTKQLSDVNESEICDTKELEDVNLNDSGDTKALSDVNVSNTSDTKQLSDVSVNAICDNSELTDNISDNDKICYYKCSDCNVCFVDHKMCLEHTQKHEILDPKTYIQCKICEFQFFIDSLKEHMVLHHNSDFRIESLTIHEYKASGTGDDPKVDVYQAIDKVQSRLVSTTTDVGVL